MKRKEPQSLVEMAAAAQSPGRLRCPKCNCPDFKTYRTTQGHVSVFRYKICRLCAHKIYTCQQPETIVRSIEPEEIEGSTFPHMESTGH